MLRIPIAVAVAALLAGCSSLRAPPPTFPESPSTPPRPGTAQPPPGAPAQAPPAATRPPKQFRLGPASSALVAQAHKQLGDGNFGLAAATIERAMRIEPDN